MSGEVWEVWSAYHERERLCPGDVRVREIAHVHYGGVGTCLSFDRAVDTRRMYRWKIDLCAVHMMCAGEWKLLVAWVHSET